MKTVSSFHLGEEGSFFAFVRQLGGIFMKKSGIFIASILLLGVIMRATFTTIPVVLDDVANTFGLPVSQLGILTTLPLLTFAVVSPMTNGIMRKFGLERTLLVALLLVFVGSWVRVFSASWLIIGTLLVGAGIAFVNVLLPAALVKFVPTKVGAYTGLYSTVMTFMTAFFQIIAVPITKAYDWQTLVLFLTVVVFLAWLTWFLHTRINGGAMADATTTTAETPAKVNPWRNKYAWAYLVMAGIQSAGFYTTIAWVPTIAQKTGLTGTEAGWVIGFLSLVGIPVSMIVPARLAKSTYKFRLKLVTTGTVAWLIAILMMFNTHAGLIWWLIITALVGFGGTIVFMYMVTSYASRTRNHMESSALSSMAQTGGYLIAAGAPWLYGVIYAQHHSWFWQTVVMAIAVIAFTVIMWLSEREETVFE